MKKTGKDRKQPRPSAKDVPDKTREAALIAFERIKAAHAKAANAVK